LVHTKLVGVWKPSFEEPRPMRSDSSHRQVLMCLEVIEDPNGENKKGRIITTNLEPYFWRRSTPFNKKK